MSLLHEHEPNVGRIFAIVAVFVVTVVSVLLWLYVTAERPTDKITYVPVKEQSSEATFTINSFQMSNAQCSYLQIQYDATAPAEPPWQNQAVKKVILDIPCLKSMWPDAEVEIRE